jgi:serine protease inhibitor
MELLVLQKDQKINTIAKFLLLSISLVFISCLPNEDPLFGRVEPNLRTLSSAEEKLSGSSTNFAIKLFQQINNTETAKNQFFSPYSIHQALAMTMNGNEGEVMEEFLQVLQMEGMSLEEANLAVKNLTSFLLDVDPKVKLNIANGIWYKEGYLVQPPFKATAQEYFQAEVAPLDMHHSNSVNVINNWIEQQTNNLIREILDQIPANAVMYLVNAIYFKGDWTYNFPRSNTKKEKFTLRDGQEIMVDMMDLGSASDLKVSFSHNEATYLEIPYSSGQYTMGVLYNESGDLSQLTSLLTKENLHHWRTSASKRGVVLKMPKFKISYKMENMGEDLMAMGLSRPFSFHPENFTKLFSNPTNDLKINRVIHQSFIEVDEKGTEAAAATIVEVIELSNSPSGPMNITLDRPFVFFIQEKHSGAILFMGKLENPLEN